MEIVNTILIISMIQWRCNAWFRKWKVERSLSFGTSRSVILFQVYFWVSCFIATDGLVYFIQSRKWKCSKLRELGPCALRSSLYVWVPMFRVQLLGYSPLKKEPMKEAFLVGRSKAWCHRTHKLGVTICKFYLQLEFWILVIALCELQTSRQLLLPLYIHS